MAGMYSHKVNTHTHTLRELAFGFAEGVAKGKDVQTLVSVLREVFGVHCFLSEEEK